MAEEKPHKRYVCYVKNCPKCGRHGQLFAEWVWNWNKSKVNGPYFRVFHLRQIWVHENYVKKLEEGLSPREASHRALKRYKPVGACYFGRVYPAPLSDKWMG